MALKQTKAIRRLYDEVLKNGSSVDQDESIQNIISLCEEKGQFIFHGDSYWSFVKSKYKDKLCIRMIFALKTAESGKVQNIERVIMIVKNLEHELVYVDNINIENSADFIYVDAIKYINK